MSLVESTGGWPRVIFPDGPKAKARRILAEVAAKHRVSVEDIRGPRRFAPVVQARREACWQIARDTNLGLPTIGVLVGKDHTSVLTAVRRQNEIAGADVRGWGGVPSAQRERNRLSSKRSRKTLTFKQKMRQSHLKVSGFRWSAERESRR